MGENYVRFIVCKTDEQIELAKDRLGGLRVLVVTAESTISDSAAEE